MIHMLYSKPSEAMWQLCVKNSLKFYSLNLTENHAIYFLWVNCPIKRTSLVVVCVWVCIYGNAAQCNTGDINNMSY